MNPRFLLAAAASLLHVVAAASSENVFAKDGVPTSQQNFLSWANEIDYTDDAYVGVGGDMVLSRAQLQQQQDRSSRSYQRVQRSRLSLLPSREAAWDVLNNDFEAAKTETAIWDTSPRQGRRTLNRMHYVLVPIWWEGESTSTSFDRSQMAEIIDYVSNYYQEKSWNAHRITYRILSQRVLTGVSIAAPTFEASAEAALQIVASEGLVQFRDYTGIMLLYNPSNSGPFSGLGGWGDVNGGFTWTSYPSTGDVARHEVGHNYGHFHHLANLYDWRQDRGDEEFAYDGWDMMSGGNGFERSDFGASSKWFFNWITNNAIITMQPEGSTAWCPACRSSISGQVLRPFDDNNVVPSSGNIMGIHIPILAIDDKVFSYWLSYRSGNDGLADGGLSVHLVWFSLGGIFGASYDSINYDAVANTETTDDSFVLPWTCYLVSPSVLLMDLDIAAVSDVQPIVCVDSVNEGNDITVSVSFLNENAPPPPAVSIASSHDIACGGGGANPVLSMRGNSHHVIHYLRTGRRGRLDATLCLDTSSGKSATAYFYDSYPHPYLRQYKYSGRPEYGAFRSIEIAPSLCNSISYQAEYDVYVIIKMNTALSSGQTASVRYSSTCSIGTCGVNQFRAGSTCQTCPDNQISTVDSNVCTVCPDGFNRASPATAQCALSENYDSSITSALGWRVWAPDFHTQRGWLWDVDFIQFFSDERCTVNVNTGTGTAIDSGNAGGDSWRPENAFSEGGTWGGGRTNDDDVFFIGMRFNIAVTVRCVVLRQSAPENVARNVRIQAQLVPGNRWLNVFIQNNLVAGENRIPIPTAAPPPPTPSPVAPPVPQPTSTGGGGGGFLLCFPGDGMVDVKDSGPTPLRDVGVGDMVMVQNGKYEPVYAFGHKIPHVPIPGFLKISAGRRELTLSRDHMVFVGSRGRAIPASLVEIGSRLQLGGPSKLVNVTNIETVWGHGLYAPFTPSGGIVVDGFRVSVFSSLQSKENVHVFEFQTIFTHQWLYQILLLPFRVWCNGFEWNPTFSSCVKEDYVEGVSFWLHYPLQCYHWWLQQDVFVQGLLSVLFLLCILLLVILNSILQYPLSFVILLMLGICSGSGSTFPRAGRGNAQPDAKN